MKKIVLIFILLSGKMFIIAQPSSDNYLTSAPSNSNFFSNYYHQTDSSNSLIKDSLVSPSIPLVILGETAIAGFLGFATGGIVAVVSHQFVFGDDNVGYTIILSYLAYSFGSALGVWTVCQENNSNSSFLEIWGVGILGAATGAALYLGSDQKGWQSAMPLILPIAFPIIYSNVFYTPKDRTIKVEIKPSLNLKNKHAVYEFNINVTF